MTFTGSNVHELQSLSQDELRQRLDNAVHDTERLPILTALGWVLAVFDTDRAEAFNNEARAINAKLDDPHYHAHIACNDARCLLYRDQYIQALTQLDEAQKLYDKVGDRSYRGGYLDLTRATILTFLLDKPEAQAAAERALTTAEATENRRLMASALNIMGSLAGASDQPDVARKWFLRCLSIYKMEGDIQGIGKTYNNIGLTYLAQQQYEAAREAAEMAIDHHQRAGYRFGMMNPHNLLGEIYAHDEQISKAIRHYQMALQIAEEFDYLAFQVVARYQMAHLQQQSGHIDAAIEGYKAAIALCPPDLEMVSIRDSHKQLAECFEQLGDYQQAMVHLREYTRIHENVTNAEIDKALAQSQDRVAAVLASRDAEEAQRRFEHADRLAALGKMAAGIAHEINNPIQAIYMNLLLLARDHDSPSLQRSIEEIERVTRLVAGMRDMYQFAPTEESLLNCSVIVHNVHTLTKKMLDEQGIIVHTDLPDDLPSIRASVTHIQQIVYNLILNARDAMPDGGTLTLSAVYDTIAEEVVLRVADTGEGITPQNRKRVFDPFFTTRTHGSGLGLSICQNILARYSGTITFSSEVGLGTTFEIRCKAWKEKPV